MKVPFREVVGASGPPLPNNTLLMSGGTEPEVSVLTLEEFDDALKLFTAYENAVLTEVLTADATVFSKIATLEPFSVALDWRTVFDKVIKRNLLFEVPLSM